MTACTNDGATVTTPVASTSVPSPSTTSQGGTPQDATPPIDANRTTSTTVAPRTPVLLRLSPAERLAAAGGVSIAVALGDEALGAMDEVEFQMTVELANDAELEFLYVAPSGEGAEVAWTQKVELDDVVGWVDVAQPWRTEREPGSEIHLVWQWLGDRDSYAAQLDRALPRVNVVSPSWWRVREDGTLADFVEPGYVGDAHEREVAIWPAIAGLNADGNHAFLAAPDTRSAVATRISEQARLLGADGINLDIEGFRDEDGPAYTEFVRELAELVHEWGGVVSHDLIPRSDSWEISPPELAFWSTAPQRRELAELTDYTVLMAYDQHNRFRPAGPVASPDWVNQVLAHSLRYTDPHELILGLPFYGRVWDPDALDAPRALPIGDLVDLAATGVSIFDDSFELQRVDLPDGRFLWLEDPALIGGRMQLAQHMGLAGWAAWRLGFASPEIWDEVPP